MKYIKSIDEAIKQELNFDNLKSEVKRWFKQRAMIPNKFTVEKVSATEQWKNELKRVRDDDLDYYWDFKDEEIPLITNDIYAAAYEYNLKTQKFRIIDSYMHVEDFNYIFLKKNISNNINYVILNVYGNIAWINKK